MKTDEELKREYRLFVGTDGILNLEFLTFLDDLRDQDRLIELIDEEGDAIFGENTNEQYNVLVDLSRIGKFKLPYPKTQQRFVKMLSKKQVGKTAFVGLNRFYKTLAYFIIKLSGKFTKVGLFDSREKAVAWLKGER